MRIQKQLGIGFLGVVAVSGLATTMAFTSQGVILRASEAVGDEAKLYASAATLERAVTKLMEGASLVVARPGDALGRQLIGEGRAELDTSIAALEQLPLDPAMEAQLDELKALAGAAVAANARVLAVVGGSPGAAAGPPERLDRSLDTLETRRRALVLKMELFVDLARARAQSARAAAAELWRGTRLGIAGLLAAALALAIAFSIVLAARLARPIEKLADAARRVGAGDLSARASIQRDDELGALSAAFDQMAADLQCAQAKLVRAERLAAIGQLAVSMQHALNNPLQGILGALSVLQDGQELPERTREALEMVHEAATRMSEVVSKVCRINDPIATVYVGKIQMLDIDRSVS